MHRVAQFAVIGVMVLLLGLVGGKIIRMWDIHAQEAAETQAYQEKVDEAKMTVEELTSDLKNLEQNDGYYEQLIREELGWVQQNEVIIIVDD